MPSDFKDGIEKLKPCPFCGGAAWSEDHPQHGARIYCNCDECLGPSTTALTMQDAIVQWNTRTTPDRSEARERIAALAYRFWSIHPSEISAKNITREQFYAREITALINNLVQDEASPAETISGRAYGLDVIDRLSKRKLTCRELARYIWDRAKNTPLAFEQDIARLIANERRQAVERSEASIRADEREKCAAIAEGFEPTGVLAQPTGEIAAAIRKGGLHD